MEECNKYSNAELVWVQEEHKNQGGWSYVQPRFQTAIGGYSRRINYCGREVRFFLSSQGLLSHVGQFQDPDKRANVKGTNSFTEN